MPCERPPMVNICLIGAGRIGRMHAGCLASHPDLRLCRVIDVNPAAARELALAHGAVAAEDPIAAIADPEVDAVLIASSSGTHALLIGAAVKARKPVFCEKPLDLDVERARDCVAEIEAAGVPVFLDFNRRFDPNHAALHQAVRAGEAGAVELVSITSRDPEPPPLAYLENAPGALFLETMVHDFDMARFLLEDEPVEVFAMASCLIEPDFRKLGEVDTAVAVLRTESGRLVQINNSWRAAYGYDQRIEVLGSGRHGALGQRAPQHARALRRAGGAHRCVRALLHRALRARSYELTLDHFADV